MCDMRRLTGVNEYAGQVYSCTILPLENLNPFPPLVAKAIFANVTLFSKYLVYSSQIMHYVGYKSCSADSVKNVRAYIQRDADVL